MQTDALDLGWKVLVTRGVIGIGFGVAAMVWPDETATVVVVLWGFWALFEGIGLLGDALRPASTGLRVLTAAMGLLSLVAAFFAIFRPVSTVTAMTWLLGIWLLVRGLFELVAAVVGGTEAPRWLIMLGGGLSIVLGVLFVANPGAGVVGITIWIGLVALLWGLVLLVAGLTMRRDIRITRDRGVQPA